jgi:hypothetical protein
MQYYEDNTLPPIVPQDTASPKQQPAKPQKSLLSLFDDPVGTPPAPTADKPVRTTAKASVRLPADHPLAKAAQEGRLRVNTRQLEGRKDKDPNAPVQAAHTPGAPAPAVVSTDPAVFDHADVGGRFTACMLLYGPADYADLHRRCLESFLASTPRERIDLRVGTNALNSESMKLLRRYEEQGVISKIYENAQNRYKYPVMRDMFYDPEHPITTKWVLWFDDDSICDRTPAWLNILAHHIIKHHRRDNAHMFGAPFIWTLQQGQKEWYERRPWHKGRPWRLHNGQPSPSGNKILFATGGFWALTHEAMVACQIPDVELGHNGGDVTIGEQLYQGGYGMKTWNAQKQFIHTSSVPRRGVTTPMPGTQGFQKPTPQVATVR